MHIFLYLIDEDAVKFYKISNTQVSLIKNYFERYCYQRKNIFFSEMYSTQDVKEHKKDRYICMERQGCLMWNLRLRYLFGYYLMIFNFMILTSLNDILIFYLIWFCRSTLWFCQNIIWFCHSII